MFRQHMKAELYAKNLNAQTPPYESNIYPPNILPIDSPEKIKM